MPSSYLPQSFSNRKELGIGKARRPAGCGGFFGDGEEFEGGLAGAARALLPTAHGVGADLRLKDKSKAKADPSPPFAENATGFGMENAESRACRLEAGARKGSNPATMKAERYFDAGEGAKAV